MGVLGKDLFDLSRLLTHTKVRFGEQGYWLENNPELVTYGSILTEILNMDFSPLQQALDCLIQAIQEKNWCQAPKAYMDLAKVFHSLPFYRLSLKEIRLIEETQTENILIGEAQRAFSQFIVEGTPKLVDIAQQTLADLQMVQERYSWFLERLFKGPISEKKKGQRKEPLAQRMIDKHLEAYVSGISLGADPKVDPPQVNIQYEVLEFPDQQPVLVEKLYFDRLADFLYVECMRGIQKGFAPKRCANCGRWFLQTPGATYAYCDEIAPGESERTCREIGAITSFREKVRNNEVWQIHQRAYKKYFARTRKNTMSRTDFEAWSRQAEELRDAALEEISHTLDVQKKSEIIQRLKEQLNQK